MDVVTAAMSTELRVRRDLSAAIARGDSVTALDPLIAELRTSEAVIAALRTAGLNGDLSGAQLHDAYGILRAVQTLLGCSAGPAQSPDSWVLETLVSALLAALAA